MNLLTTILKMFDPGQEQPMPMPSMDTPGILPMLMGVISQGGVFGSQPSAQGGLGGMDSDGSPVSGELPKMMYDYMTQKGVSHNHALGMLANIRAESNFNPSAVGDNGNAYGLFQHNGPRMKALFATSGSTKPSWQQQIDYALSEGDTQNYLKKQFADPKQATKDFMINWERPSDKSQRKINQRIRYIPNFNANQGIPTPPIKTPGPAPIALSQILDLLKGFA